MLWPVNCLDVTTMPTYASSHCVLTSLGDMYRMVRFCTAETRNAAFIKAGNLFLEEDLKTKTYTLKVFRSRVTRRYNDAYSTRSVRLW
jgi:hypothetical protein